MILTKSNLDDYTNWISTANSDGAFALIDKDCKWTSFDVIAKLRRLTGIRKIGHSGTLDPLATGLLIIGFGKGTKKLIEFQDLNKTYFAMIRIGAITKSDDCEYDEENVIEINHLDNSIIHNTIASFIGKIKQVPPMFSAKQVDGKRLYKLARKDKNLEISAIEVTIHSIKISKIELPHIEIIVDCSKGTYIRSLARDIGNKLGIGGYLKELRRLSIGEYDVSKALKIEDFANIVNSNTMNSYFT